MSDPKTIRRFKIMVAPNGARKTQSDHANLPLTPAQLAVTARACADAGANAFHLHVRDKGGRHSLDAGRYREAIEAIGEAVPEMQIQITTESAGIYDVAAQKACLEALRPTAASVSIREMARDPALGAQVYRQAREMGTDVQHILYGPECVDQLQHWQKMGVISTGAQNVICVLGAYKPARAAKVSDFDIFGAVMQGKNWWACAFGEDEHACLREALRRGGNVRIGFENSLGDANGMHASNEASITRFLASLEYIQT